MQQLRYGLVCSVLKITLDCQDSDSDHFILPLKRADVASLTKYYIVCCERGDYNFSLIGSNNACSDIRL